MISDNVLPFWGKSLPIMKRSFSFYQTHVSCSWRERCHEWGRHKDSKVENDWNLFLSFSLSLSSSFSSEERKCDQSANVHSILSYVLDGNSFIHTLWAFFHLLLLSGLWPLFSFLSSFTLVYLILPANNVVIKLTWAYLFSRSNISLLPWYLPSFPPLIQYRLYNFSFSFASGFTPFLAQKVWVVVGGFCEWFCGEVS